MAEMGEVHEISSRRKVGPYRLERLIGVGGMAEVHTATHQGSFGFERRVCIKRILPHLAKDPEFHALFMREARISGKLRHGNLVQVFQCLDDPELALVMELVDGMDLRELLRRLKKGGRKLSEGLVVFIASQMLLGLDYAHSEGIVHRDVSPHNVLLSRNGEVKIGDFGVAKSQFSHWTKTGDFKGKLTYMAPEQALGRSVDNRTDLYAAGLVIFELLTGERFYTQRGQAELIGAVAHAQRPTIEGCDPKLAAMIEQLLEPSPEDRFQAARDAVVGLLVPPTGALELGELVTSMLGDEQVPPRQTTESTTVSPFVADAESGSRPTTVETAPAKKSAIGPKTDEDDAPFGFASTETQDARVVALNPKPRTETLPDGPFEPKRLPRPVSKSSPNAPTETREDNLDQAFASAATLEDDEPDATAPGVRPPEDEQEAIPTEELSATRQARQSAGRKALWLGVVLVVGLVIGLGTAIGLLSMSRAPAPASVEHMEAPPETPATPEKASTVLSEPSPTAEPVPAKTIILPPSVQGTGTLLQGVSEQSLDEQGSAARRAENRPEAPEQNPPAAPSKASSSRLRSNPLTDTPEESTPSSGRFRKRAF